MGVDLLSKIQQLLILHEGSKLKPYVDSEGKITIGVGRNLTDEGISSEESLLLFRNDVTETVKELDSHIKWWRTLDEVRMLVMIDMCFNLGIGSLLKFTNM